MATVNEAYEVLSKPGMYLPRFFFLSPCHSPFSLPGICVLLADKISSPQTSNAASTPAKIPTILSPAKTHSGGTGAEVSQVDIRLHSSSRVEVKEEDSSSSIVDSSRMLLYWWYIDLNRIDLFVFIVALAPLPIPDSASCTACASIFLSVRGCVSRLLHSISSLLSEWMLYG